MKSGTKRNGRQKAKTLARGIEPGSGNVFADLGMPDAEERLARCELAQKVCDAIAERKLSQRGAAAVLGVDQPKVSALIRGKLDGFSTDRLFRFLNALGRDVEIVVRPKARRSTASVRVLSPAKVG